MFKNLNCVIGLLIVKVESKHNFVNNEKTPILKDFYIPTL